MPAHASAYSWVMTSSFPGPNRLRREVSVANKLELFGLVTCGIAIVIPWLAVYMFAALLVVVGNYLKMQSMKLPLDRATLSMIDRWFFVAVPVAAIIVPCIATAAALTSPTLDSNIGVVALPLLIIPVVLGLAALRSYRCLART